MKVVIIEDEKHAQEKLERMLLQIVPDIDIANKIETVSQSIEWLSKNEVDLIFLDIHLADGASFSIFEKVNTNIPIIFTTAYDEYAIKAFSVNSIDYLLKPININSLTKAIEKFQSQQLPKIDIQKILNQLYQPKPKYLERILLQKGEQYFVVDLQSVLYFFADGKYVFLVDENGYQNIINYTIEKLSEELNPLNFFRVNRKFIIKINAIDKMTKWTKSRIQLLLTKYPEPIVVSAYRVKDFKNWLEQKPISII